MSVRTYTRTLVRTISILSVAAIVYLGLMVFQDPVVDTGGSIEVAGTGSVSNFETAYQKWSEGYGKADPKGPVVTLEWTRGLSSEYSAAKGIAQLDLERNLVSVRVKGLEEGITDVWFVNNLPGEGHSVVPEEGDEMVHIGQLNFDGDNAWLDATIENLADFELDMVVLTPSDTNPGQDRVLLGTTSLFQKLYHYPQSERAQAVLAKNETGISLISSANANGGITPPTAGVDYRLLNRGRKLFFDETFDGNGRSCGTCHLEDDNFALSLKSIAALPDSDPLFIVEQRFRRDGSRNALYNEFRMEKPALMRKLGLIVENLNGFRDPDGSFTNNVAMRAPNHVLSVRTTLAPPPAQQFDDGTLPIDANDLNFEERTGWGGDGTPTGFRADFFESNGRDLTGSLRDFVIGAIVQHYPLTLERSAFDRDERGRPRQPDFRFATESELDAIEAFMLSVGRQEENDDLDTIRLTDEVADRGRLNYMGFNVFDADPNDDIPALNCNACHFNGGANTNPTHAFPAAVTPNHGPADIAANGGSIPSHNRSFGPAVERLADQAPDIIVQVSSDPSVRGNCFINGYAEVPLLPGDGPGNGPSAGCDANRFDNGFADPGGRAADDRFNVPPVFDAMDTAPFFHGHQINTIEGSVAFYATNRLLRNGEFLGAIVPLNAPQVINVARFMRVMGADFNLESAHDLLHKADRLSRSSDRITNVKLALAEARDALELLDPVDLHIEDGVPLIELAIDRLERASFSGSRFYISRAHNLIRDAQRAMVVRGL